MKTYWYTFLQQIEFRTNEVFKSERASCIKQQKNPTHCLPNEPRFCLAADLSAPKPFKTWMLFLGSKIIIKGLDITISIPDTKTIINSTILCLFENIFKIESKKWSILPILKFRTQEAKGVGKLWGSRKIIDQKSKSWSETKQKLDQIDNSTQAN